MVFLQHFLKLYDLGKSPAVPRPQSGRAASREQVRTLGHPVPPLWSPSGTSGCRRVFSLSFPFPPLPTPLTSRVPPADLSLRWPLFLVLKNYLGFPGAVLSLCNSPKGVSHVRGDSSVMKISGSEGQGGKWKSASATRHSGSTAVCPGACWSNPNTNRSPAGRGGTGIMGVVRAGWGPLEKESLQKLRIKQFSKIKVTLIL